MVPTIKKKIYIYIYLEPFDDPCFGSSLLLVILDGLSLTWFQASTLIAAGKELEYVPNRSNVKADVFSMEVFFLKNREFPETSCWLMLEEIKIKCSYMDLSPIIMGVF